jgi:hypothetical protein
MRAGAEGNTHPAGTGPSARAPAHPRTRPPAPAVPAHNQGFCKQQLWPLFHYILPMSPYSAGRYDSELWQAYVKANKVKGSGVGVGRGWASGKGRGLMMRGHSRSPSRAPSSKPPRPLPASRRLPTPRAPGLHREGRGGVRHRRRLRLDP